MSSLAMAALNRPFVFLPLAWIHIAVVQYFSLELSTDYGALALATQNLLDGYGVGLRYADLADLAEPAFARQQLWPPGYNFFLAPVIALIPDAWLAAYTLDVLFTGILLLSSFALLVRLTPMIPVAGRAAFLAFWIFLYPTRWSVWTGGDLICLALFVSGMVLIIRFFQERRRPALCGAWAGALFGLAALTRMAYVPVCAASAAAVLFLGRRGGPERRFALVFAAAAGTGVAATMLWMQWYGAGWNVLDVIFQHPKPAMLWGRLLETCPFPSLIVDAGECGVPWKWGVYWTATKELVRMSGIAWSANSVYTAFRWALSAFVAYCAWAGFHEGARRAQTSSASAAWRNLFCVWIAVIVLTEMQLAYLAVRYPAAAPGLIFSHVTLSRYHAITVPFFVFAVSAFLAPGTVKRLSRTVARVVLAAALVVAGWDTVSRWTWLRWVIAQYDVSDPSYIRGHNPEGRAFGRVFIDHPDRAEVYLESFGPDVPESHRRRIQATLAGMTGAQLMGPLRVATSAPVTALIGVNPDDQGAAARYLRAVCERRNAVPLGKYGNVHTWLLRIEPGAPLDPKDFGF